MKRRRAGVSWTKAIAIAGITAATACGCQLAWQPPASPAPHTLSGVPASAIAGPGLLDGLYEPGLPLNWSGVDGFTRATGLRPRIILYYSGWNEKFRMAAAEKARSENAYLLVQLDPDRASSASIAAGRSDRYLYSYAEAVRNYGYPVILSFGHEMNGGWYSWGDGHTQSSTFIAAWRHVVEVFRNAGATNVTWMWTVNSASAANGDLRQWWPGARWVDWVGIDGYYVRPSDTFASVFGQTLAIVRKFSAAPALISETGVGTTSDRESQIAGLFAGADAAHMAGVVWFDSKQRGSIYRQDWRLEDDRPALAEFAAGAREHAKHRQR